MPNIPIWKAIFLGALQGLTEFLPVSSSAHLVIFQQYLGLTHEGSFLMAFDVALHFGTLGAVVAFFYKDILWFFQNGKGRRIGFLVLLATLPAGVVGIYLKDFFETLFADVISASFFLMITGWILWLTKRAKPPISDFPTLTVKQALLIGLAQAAAILPGISRSGATIGTALFLRVMPREAVRFSFLMAIPAIAGATLLETDKFTAMQWNILIPILLGMLTAFGCGTLAIRWMFKIVQRQKLETFAWYCWLVGGFVFIRELFF